MYDNHLFDITVWIYRSTRAIMHSAATAEMADNLDHADLAGGKPGRIKWTNTLSQTETFHVPSLATEWSCNMLQVATEQSTTETQFLG